MKAAQEPSVDRDVNRNEVQMETRSRVGHHHRPGGDGVDGVAGETESGKGDQQETGRFRGRWRGMLCRQRGIDTVQGTGMGGCRQRGMMYRQRGLETIEGRGKCRYRQYCIV